MGRPGRRILPGVEGDQVHVRTDPGRGQAAQLPQQFPGVVGAVVLTAEQDVLDGDPAA